MPGTRTTSLREHSIRYSVIIFIVIFIAAVLHYFVFSRYLKELEQQEQEKVLHNVSTNISRAIDFYQALIDKISEQQRVRTLIELGTDESVQHWANDMQHMVPDSIGFSVFDRYGTVKGVREQLRLGQACMSDINRHLSGEVITRPAVHRGMQGMEHFDVISDVVQGRDTIGVAFSSFSLDVMKRLLNEVASENNAYRLIDQTGQVIAASRNLDQLRQAGNMFRHPVHGTDWEIEMYVYGDKQEILATSLMVSNFLTFIFVCVILYFAMSRLIYVVINDFEMVSTIMAKIRNGTFKIDDGQKPRLRESAGIIHFMQYTAQELNNYQKKLEHESTTDELTGLYNRRILNQQLDKLLVPGNEQDHYHLLIIDIDFFKEVNDSYGHDVGDEILLMFSQALIQFTGEGDISTRAGGDEFIVLLKDHTREQIQSWYEKIKTHMNHQVGQYNRDNNLQVEFGLSVGCTPIRNNDIKGVILKRADEALYNVKMSGRNNIECV